MAKQSFQRNGWVQETRLGAVLISGVAPGSRPERAALTGGATFKFGQHPRLLLFAALVLVVGVSLRGADQQASPRSAPSPKPAPTSGQKREKTIPAKSAKTSAQRKSPTANASISTLEAGKRDPFKLPEVSSGKGGGENIMESAGGGVLPRGKQGLLIAHIMLEGVVREQTDNKMTAVVIDERKYAYFLHENESVYNGVVSKITPDAVYFKENVLDSSGRVTTREVVKRLGSAPGEGR